MLAGLVSDSESVLLTEPLTGLSTSSVGVLTSEDKLLLRLEDTESICFLDNAPRPSLLPDPRRGLTHESETSDPSLCLADDRELMLRSEAAESRRPRCDELWLLSEAPESSRDRWFEPTLLSDATES